MRPLFVLLGLLALAEPAVANWTLNVGYQNPTNATYGLNFLYLGSRWGFEAGIGWLDLATQGFQGRRDNMRRLRRRYDRGVRRDGKVRRGEVS